MATYPDLRDANVVITGGANGIGAAMVRSFHEQGARVFFCDVDRPAGTGLAKQLNVSFNQVDLRDEPAVRAWIESVGPIRVLVNNAARDPRIPIEKMTREQWDDLFATNLRPLMFTCKAAAKRMKPGSAIINFSSITFHIAPAEMTAYVATKAAILGFTRSLARELGPRRIRVNAISPGWVMTERQVREFITPAVKRLIHRSQCIPDRIQPEEIAPIALFLASDASTAMTGQELLADRGWSYS
jgi:D-xylose 1-dehydrogenase